MLDDIARTLDYTKFRDRGFPGKYLGPLGFLTDGFSVLFADPGDDGRIQHRYGLVVTASDLSRKRLVQLPWDYVDYGLDPCDIARSVGTARSGTRTVEASADSRCHQQIHDVGQESVANCRTGIPNP